MEAKNDYKIYWDDEVASLCKYGKSFVYEVLEGCNYTNIFTREVLRPMSKRKVEGFKKLAEKRLYYQKNPVKFIEDFFQIQLVDSQAYLFQAAWICPNVLIVASRAYGKSFWISLFIMAKQMLSSDPWSCYIAAGTSQQSATTFKKIEDIANDNITSLIGSTGGIFKDEVEVKNATGDGFTHAAAGHTYTIYNASTTTSIGSNTDSGRGKRSECVVFDECGFLDANLIQVYGAFVAVDENFKTGFDEHGNTIDIVRSIAKPKGIPKQKIYVSSASSTDTEFYALYRSFSKSMIMGDTDYFVAHIDCDLVMSPTIHNVATSPALSRNQVETAMKVNPEKARREYYCQFTTDAGANAIIRRGSIVRNEEVRKPLLANYEFLGKGLDGKFIITYDPARIRDNSVILIGQLFYEGSELKIRLVNCINLIDVEKATKRPMTIPNQVIELRRIIMDYNNGGDEFYSNIVGVYIDAGSGGQASAICDLLMQNWEDESGTIRKGFIDKEYSKDYVKDFPSAVNILHMMPPAAFKSEMYESLIQMIDENHLKFTAAYDNKGYLTTVEVDSKLLEEERRKIIEKNKKATPAKLEELIKERLEELDCSKTKIVKLNIQEEVALTSMDALKEELVNMVRIKRDSGKDSFELCPEKRNRMHDDRAYTCAMMGYALKEERRKLIFAKPKKSFVDISSRLANVSRKATRRF